MTPRRVLTILALAAAMVPGLAAAAPACVAPRDLKPWPGKAPKPEEIQAGVTIAYHLLTISWAPEWRRTNGRGITAERLDIGGPGGFFLHGLWPNGAVPPYPRYCHPVGGLTPALVRQMYCRTPSAELLQHEWAAHGACGWTDPRSYFRQSSKLYDRIVMPRVENIAPDGLTAGALRKAFVARNPWMRADMLWVQSGEAQQLTEIRVCHDLAFRPMRCPGGLGAPDSAHLRLTPSATGAF